MRRWVDVLFEPTGLAGTRALALSALVHVAPGGSDAEAVRRICRPRTILLLDESAASLTGFGVGSTRRSHPIPDPHRPAQRYEGWWGRDADGIVVGKAPQHPAARQLYRASDMDAFLRDRPGG